MKAPPTRNWHCRYLCIKSAAITVTHRLCLSLSGSRLFHQISHSRPLSLLSIPPPNPPSQPPAVFLRNVCSLLFSLWRAGGGSKGETGVLSADKARVQICTDTLTNDLECPSGNKKQKSDYNHHLPFKGCWGFESNRGVHYIWFMIILVLSLIMFLIIVLYC